MANHDLTQEFDTWYIESILTYRYKKVKYDIVVKTLIIVFLIISKSTKMSIMKHKIKLTKE